MHYTDVKDRITGKWRSFKTEESNWDWDGFNRSNKELESGKFSYKPSIDEFVDILKKAKRSNRLPYIEGYRLLRAPVYFSLAKCLSKPSRGTKRK
jgi:hypothetical protein